MSFTPAPEICLSDNVSKAVETGADNESPASSEGNRAGWQRIIDSTLMNWLRDPSVLSDEDVDVPSGTILRLSLDLAERYQNEGFPPPDTIVPDPNGGIVFERHEDDTAEVFHIWDDGTIEYMGFIGAQLVKRYTLYAPCNW